MSPQVNVTLIKVYVINLSNKYDRNEHTNLYHRALSKRFIKEYILGIPGSYPGRTKSLKNSTWRRIIIPTLKALLGEHYQREIIKLRYESMMHGPCRALRRLLKILEEKEKEIEKAVLNNKISERNLKEIKRSIKNVRELLKEFGCLIISDIE